MPMRHGVKFVQVALLQKRAFCTTVNFYRTNIVQCRPTSLNLNFYIQQIPSFRTRHIFPSATNLCVKHRQYCASKNEAEEPEQKLTLFQKFKQMYRDYWYVLVPVHVVTSAIWIGSFYYLVKSGIDVASLVEHLGEPGEKLATKLRNGNGTMGTLAVVFTVYKIVTPLRYTVTLGGTTVSIKYLRDWGYIKPIPPKEKIKSMITEQKSAIMVKGKEIIEKEKKLMLDDKGFSRVFFSYTLKCKNPPKIKKPEKK